MTFSHTQAAGYDHYERQGLFSRRQEQLAVDNKWLTTVGIVDDLVVVERIGARYVDVETLQTSEGDRLLPKPGDIFHHLDPRYLSPSGSSTGWPHVLESPAMQKLIVSTLCLFLFCAGCGSSASVESSVAKQGVVATTTTAAPATTTAAPATTMMSATKGGAGRTSSDTSWTVLVYVMGDTDLEAFALTDLEEMAEIDTTGEVNVVALVDRTPDFPGSGGYTDAGIFGAPNWEGVQLIEFVDGEVAVLSPPEEVEANLGTAGELESFVSYGLTTFPAAKNALVLWDHGGGWTGMGPDETDGWDILNLTEIRNGLQAGLDSADVDRLDLIGFDACLMATYEVAASVAGLADTLVASEELEPGHGWDYRAFNSLATGKATSGEELGIAIADSYMQHARDYGTDTNVTLSVIDLDAFSDVQDALVGFTGPMVEYPTEAAPEVARALTETMQFGSSPNPENSSNIFDLGDFASNLLGFGIDSEIDELHSAMNEAVVYKVAGPVAGRATGLSIYLPAKSEYFNPNYVDDGFAPEWETFLQSHYQAGTQIPEESVARFLEESGTYFFDEDGLNFVGYVDPTAEDAVAEVVIYYGAVDPEDDNLYFIGEESGWIAGDGSGLLTAIYDLTILTISDGYDTSYAYTDFYYDEAEDLLLFDVPMTYGSADLTDDSYIDLVLSLAVDATAGEVISEIYYQVDEFGQWSEFIADPEGFIWPSVLMEEDDGELFWVDGGDIPLYADIPSLEYSFEPLPSGITLVAELWVFDYAGNSDFLSLVDLVP